MRNNSLLQTIKKTAIIITVICTVTLVLPIVLVSVIPSFYRNPPKPEHKYGEFPFSLTYEINGELKEVKDTLVIEYEGIDWNEGLGKYNLWNTYYKSSKTSDEDLELFNDYVDGIGSVIISYKLGSCEYYMGLPETEHLYKSGVIIPGDIMITSPKETRVITNEELYNNYKIRIIEKSISSPLS